MTPVFIRKRYSVIIKRLFWCIQSEAGEVLWVIALQNESFNNLFNDLMELLQNNNKVRAIPAPPTMEWGAYVISARAREHP